MEKTEGANKPKLLGKDQLTLEQVRAMPKEERLAYIKDMSAKDVGHYMTSGFMANLNANAKEED